ncbi:MAG: DNA polymerase III subunit beta [Methylococcaceae bacterium]
MKLSITRENLLGPLQQVVSVIERKQTLPILSNVLLRLVDDRLYLTGTDLELQLVTLTTVESGEPGQTTLPARKFLDIIRLSPEKSLLKINCRGDRAELSSSTSRYTLSTLPADNYPQFDSGAVDVEFQIPASLLKKAMDKTMFAMAVQDHRYFLNGLLLDFDGKSLKAVASDGHRLCYFREELDNAPLQDSRQIIIPRKGITELYRLLGDSEESLSFRISANTVQVELGHFCFSAKLIEGRYPDYQRVIPKDITHRLMAERTPLKSALTRVAVLSHEKYKGMSLEVADDETLCLKAQNPEHEEAEEKLTIETEGGKFQVGFNFTYLLDAINNIDSERVKLSLPSGCSSCLIEDTQDSRFIFIVMPMRL